MKKSLWLAIALVVFSTSLFKPTIAEIDNTPKQIKTTQETTTPIKAVTTPVEQPEVKKISWWGKLKNFFSLEGFDLKNISLWYVLLIAFLIGIATSFTPCIYPMIPITIGILQSQASPSLGRNFILSSSYVAGMATVYATLGYFAATTTLVLGQWLGNPWVVALIILMFLYLAFSMFGFYEIYMPRFLQKGSSVKVKGSVLYSFLFGAVSGTAASPCLTPAIAILLGYVAKRGNPLIGFITLFVFAMGLGLLLIFLGTFSTTITAMPRAGMWMNEIKKIFGFLLLGVCVYFLQLFISPFTATLLYTLVVLITLGYYGMVIVKAITKKKK